jgi:hypothetical protein
MRLLHHCPTIWCSRQRLQTEETAINLFIDISEVQQVAIASLLPCFLVQSPTRTRAYNMLVSRSHSFEVQQVAIVSLLFCFLLQSPTRTNIFELPDVIPADAGIARRVKKLSPVPFDCALRQA